MKGILFTAAIAALAGTASAQVVVSGDLTNGASQNGVITVNGNTNTNSSAWSYWTFAANAGDNINVNVDRITGELDPIAAVHFGNVAGASFADLPDLINWNAAGLTFVAIGDDDEPPAVPGPFGDPNFGFVAANSGIYSIAVSSFASGQIPANGYQFSIVVTGSTVPTPAAATLLGLGGLVALRRRR